MQTEGFENEPLYPIIAEALAPLGYEVVAIERVIHKEKKLRLYIDWSTESGKSGISLDDCVKVSHALDAPLEGNPVVEKAFPTGYDLEVSSPGIDRPLKRKADFARFKEKPVRIHTFRPLTDTECKNAEYIKKNPKQKHFIGTLQGLNGDEVLVQINKDQIHIPFPLISKAHLEPQFNSSQLDKQLRQQPKGKAV